MSTNSSFVRGDKAWRAVLALLLLVGLIGFAAPGDITSALAAGDPVVAAAGDIACDPHPVPALMLGTADPAAAARNILPICW